MCLPSNGKREHFSETTVDSRLLVSQADKLRGTRKPRVQPVSPLVASRIGHPSSKLGPRLLLDTATRCGEEGKRETSLREEATTSHRGLFTREFNLCALLYSNEQVCRVQSRNTKKTSNVVPAIPLRRYIYSPLSKSVLSRVVFAEEIVSRGWRGSNFFLPDYSSLPTSVRIPFSFEYSGSTFTFV